MGLCCLSVDYSTDGPRATPLRIGLLPPPPPGGARWRWLPSFDLGDGASAGHNAFNRVFGADFPDGRSRYYMCYSHINPQWFKKNKDKFDRVAENYGRAIDVSVAPYVRIKDYNGFRIIKSLIQ